MSDFQSKIIEVKHLVTEVTDLFIKQKSVLDSMSETISKFGKGAKLPSEFSNAQKEVNKNLEKQSDLQKKIEQNAKNQSKAMQNLAMQDWKTQEEALKREEKLAEQSIKNAKAKLAMISSLNKQRYTEEEKLAQDAEKAMLHKHQEELRQIKAKQALIYSLGQQRLRQEAQEAKDGRTGASSTIPGMAGKISDLKESERQALANEKLNRAYVQLSATREKAKNKLQDLIASEKASNNEIRQAQKEFDVLNKKVAAADKAVGRFSDANRKINGLSQSVGNLMTAFGISTGIYLAVDIAKSIYETTKQLQSLDLALKMVSGSQEEFVSNQVFLKSLAEQYGIEIKGLTKNFTEFWVASKGKLEAEQIKAIFTSISKSVAVMGLSVEQQDSAFLALQQMMSKGTVQAEELKKQLGNALPGAIKAATMAYQTLHPEMKVTEKFFMEQMKAGKVLSSELLPELAKAYEKLYGIENVKRAETLQAAQERLANSWTDLVRNMNESETSGIGAFFGFLINMATQAISWIDRASSSWSQLQKKAGGKGIAIGEQSFNEQLKEDYKPLTSDEKNKIKSRIKEINEEILKASTSNQRQAELRGEKEGLEATLFKSDKKKVLINIRDANRAILDGYIKEYKELDKKTREVGKNLTGDDFAYFVERGIDPKRKEELLQLINEYKTVFYKSNARLISDSKLGNKKPNQAGGGGTGTRSDNDSAERDRLALIEKNAKIEYDLKISNLNREKEIIKDLRDDKETSLEDMLFLEQAYAYKEMQIALAVYEEEVRLAGKSESMQAIALNKFLTEKENLIKESLDRQSKFTVDFNEEQKNKTKEWYKNNPPIGIFDTEANKKDREESEQELKDALRARIKIFNDYVGDFANKSGFGESFDLMTKINPKTNKSLFERLLGDSDDGLGEWEDYFTAISTIAQDAFNLINQASEQRFEKEYQRLEKDKENALRFAGDSESQRLRIEEEYEKRRKEIAKKQWQAKKKQAIVNIAIDTAQAIVGLWVKPGFPAAIPMAIAMAGLGAVQAGFVAAQKAPEFYVGTQNAPEGLAWTNERGAELHTDKKGNIKDFGDNKGSRLTMLEAGDKIYTAEQTKRILFNDELNNILTSNNIMPSSINIQSNGVSATQMDAIIGKHFSNIQTNNTMIDRNGFTSWTEKNGNKTISDNNRVQRKGLIIK